jgi:hypothetical protein
MKNELEQAERILKELRSISSDTIQVQKLSDILKKSLESSDQNPVK